ncbi:nuclease-related domain-containing protein [Ilumatobacter coccineus]|uniref:NERD domain-containing protein n=1 Tax=Ilumatobacter coccineus (strain NBRC 103263 / KCTC 29153 / YM16-304) TaxID=1313172 RepID=A0A6C7E803_ILUCY|nr:nuclease-related domain-containing protein [Ilumatobacter coccineus]BAN01285.1 hypothetical protein YM304_09710 [Ilumatobacter coccineus YM16-304]
MADRRRSQPSKRFSWGRTTIRERRLGARLDRELAPIGAVLHGCRIPDATHRIDHLIVAPTGVWTVVAEHSSGAVSVTGPKGDQRLHLGDQDQQGRITTASFAAERVRQLLVPVGFDWVDVSATLCFTNAKWGMIAKEVEIGGVCVTWGKALVDRVGTPGPISVKDAKSIAEVLGQQVIVDDVSTRRT